MPEETPLLLDTDVGSDIDDALCLSYLLAERRSHLLGVSTVSGGAPQRAMLADALCKAAGRYDVPVWAGTEAPLLGEQQQPDVPQESALNNWEHESDFEPNEAVWKMRETIREYPGNPVLLTVGPLTNVGLLFSLDPEIPRMLDRLVVMGGRFFMEGSPEWNIRCDPYAASIALSAPVRKIQIYALDVTTQCVMNADECRERFTGGPLDMVAEMAEVWFGERDKVTFHDPLAACAVFEPEMCNYRNGKIHVGVDSGSTVLKSVEGGAGQVAESVDSDRFFERYFGTVEAFV